jgi:hypothetical protein
MSLSFLPPFYELIDQQRYFRRTVSKDEKLRASRGDEDLCYCHVLVRFAWQRVHVAAIEQECGSSAFRFVSSLSVSDDSGTMHELMREIETLFVKPRVKFAEQE